MMKMIIRILNTLHWINPRLPENLELKSLQDEYKFISFRSHYLIKNISKIKFRRYMKYKFIEHFSKIAAFCIAIFIIAMAYRFYSRPVLISYPIRNVVVYKSDSTRNLHTFLDSISHMESRDNQFAVNGEHLGLYQIGEKERRNAGYGDIEKTVYLNHPEIQEICMINLLKYNKRYLKKYINKYSGKIVDGILMTESGILALAHLGVGYAEGCLDRDNIPVNDSYGNHPRSYAVLGGYKLDLDK